VVVVAVVLAIGVGTAVAVQSSILGGASRSLHPLSLSLALQVAGVAIGVSWAVYARAWSEVFVVARQWWWLPLGLVGLGVVAAIGFSSARLGTLTTLALIIGAQLVAGLILDVATGTVALDVRQLVGVGIVIGGVVVLTWR
jgi:uncharacterized membrane protein YdcZ (DUF606 family)